MGTNKSTDDIEKSWMYQTITTMIKLYMSRRTVVKEPGNKNQGTTRTKKMKINATIEKWTITKKRINTRIKTPQNKSSTKN